MHGALRMADTQADAFKWYAVRTLTNQELKVKRFIEQACEAGVLKDCVKKVLVPTKTVLEVKNGKKTSRVCKFFPGYVFLCMKLYDEAGEFLQDTALFVRRIQGVTGFMGGDRRPTAMRPSEAEALLNRVEENREKKVLGADYSVGGKVKVTDGAFVGSSAVIDEVDAEKGRLRVSVSIFGRSTPVELEYWQVQKES